MKLICIALPLTTALALGSVIPFAVQPSQPPLLPPAPAPKPLASPPALAAKPFALPPALAAKPFALPLPARPPGAPFPGQSHTFIVPSPQGGQTLINIPRCYFVFGLQSLGGVTQFTDQAGHPLPLPASPQVLSSAGRPPAPR